MDKLIGAYRPYYIGILLKSIGNLLTLYYSEQQKRIFYSILDSQSNLTAKKNSSGFFFAQDKAFIDVSFLHLNNQYNVFVKSVPIVNASKKR